MAVKREREEERLKNESIKFILSTSDFSCQIEKQKICDFQITMSRSNVKVKGQRLRSEVKVRGQGQRSRSEVKVKGRCNAGKATRGTTHAIFFYKKAEIRNFQTMHPR